MVRKANLLTTARWLRVLAMVATLLAVSAALPTARAKAFTGIPLQPPGSHPAVLGSPNSGNMAVFFNSDAALEENFYFVSSNRWSGPMALPGLISGTDSPVAVGNPNSGNMAVFYDVGNTLQYDFYSVASNTWGGPYQLPGNPANGPVAAIGSPNGGNIAVFFDNTADGILTQDLYQVATNSWTGTSIGGEIMSPAQPAAVGDANGGNRAVFFTDGVLGQEFTLAMNYFFGATSTWSGPVAIGGQIT